MAASCLRGRDRAAEGCPAQFALVPDGAEASGRRLQLGMTPDQFQAWLAAWLPWITGAMTGWQFLDCIPRYTPACAFLTMQWRSCTQKLEAHPFACTSQCCGFCCSFLSPPVYSFLIRQCKVHRRLPSLSQAPSVGIGRVQRIR